MPSQLAVDDISVAFGGHRALDGVALTAERGQVTGLIGPNGAGKSTLFDVVSGLRKPLSGTVSLNGRDVTRAGPARRARHGLARTFQRLELFGRLSVRDNLRFAVHQVPAKAQYWRSRKLPECAMTVARKQDWRSVNPRGSRQMARSATTSRKPRRFTGSPHDLLG